MGRVPLLAGSGKGCQCSGTLYLDVEDEFRRIAARRHGLAAVVVLSSNSLGYPQAKSKNCTTVEKLRKKCILSWSRVAIPNSPATCVTRTLQN